MGSYEHKDKKFNDKALNKPNLRDSYDLILQSTDPIDKRLLNLYQSKSNLNKTDLSTKKFTRPSIFEASSLNIEEINSCILHRFEINDNEP